MFLSNETVNCISQNFIIINLCPVPETNYILENVVRIINKCNMGLKLETEFVKFTTFGIEIYKWIIRPS